MFNTKNWNPIIDEEVSTTEDINIKVIEVISILSIVFIYSIIKLF